MAENFRNEFKLLYLSLFFGLIGILSKVLYRPWIIDNNINDFGVHGFAPNLIYTTGICLFASFFLKKGHVKTMIYCTVGVLVYETEQLWTSRTFDYLDILATISGLGLAILIFRVISRKWKLTTTEVLD